MTVPTLAQDPCTTLWGPAQLSTPFNYPLLEWSHLLCRFFPTGVLTMAFGERERFCGFPRGLTLSAWTAKSRDREGVSEKVQDSVHFGQYDPDG